MVSRRNFFNIIMMMAVLLFMFQFSQVIKENESGYDVNDFLLDEAEPGAERWRADAVSGAIYEDGDFVVFCGGRDGAVCGVVEQWCLYTKRNLVICEDISDYSGTKECLPEAFLIDSNGMDLVENLPLLYDLTDSGVTLIFCSLPDASVMRREKQLWDLLGIQSVSSEEIEVEGIHLFDGFLLGGESIYKAENEEDEKKQDMDLNVSWYVTSSGTKTYMAGILDELLKRNEAKNEYFPALIWRSSYGQSMIFTVNGGYLSDMAGIGILDGIMYEADTYDIYPVVNAQNVIVSDFPDFSGENDEMMMRLYSRQTNGVFRDICWPGLSSLAERNKLKLTCMFAPQYQYLDEIEPSGENVSFYLQQMKESGAEAGISLSHGEGITLAEKLGRDGQFYDSLNNRYLYSAAFAEAEDLKELEEEWEGGAALLKNIRTLACGASLDDPVVSYLNDAVTLQAVTSDAGAHTYFNDFFERSIETALAYSNVRIDMHDVVWPDSEEDQWENMFEKVVSNLDTYWASFSLFTKTTMTESDRRIRSFLNLDYHDRREGDDIDLDVSGTEESWFILRTHGECIDSISGADYEEIETGAYLLHVTEEHVKIRLGRERGLLKYKL